MDLDEDVCLCFHVSRRKLENYLRIEQPGHASQLSQCGGAGTGCGWCVPILETMFQSHQNQTEIELPTAEDHASKRQTYLKKTDRK